MAPAPLRQPDVPAHVDQTIGFLRQLSDGLRSYQVSRDSWNFHLNEQQLATLSVRCTPLDLDSPDAMAGPGNGTGFQFLRPVPMKTMEEWLEEKKPWKSMGCLPLGPKEIGNRPWVGAQSVSGNLDSWLRSAEGPELAFLPGVMDVKTCWRSNIERFSFMEPRPKYAVEGPYYDVGWIFEHRSQDGVKPHIVASLRDNNPICQDGLTISEVATIAKLTAYRFLTKVMDYRIVPVTIMSISARDVRVIHAYIDGQNGVVNVRKSPIFNFDCGEDASLDDWKRLLCWIVAEPDLEVVRALEKFHARQSGRR